ncbi:MAG: YdiU family protein [Alphaproteobacteria bacterium]|nr:YdiU family protein [Alphaproteobacteria bacterium]
MSSAQSLFRPEVIHQQLDQRFYRPVAAAQFPQHQLRYRNHAAAKSVGLDDLDDTSWIRHFGHFQPLDGSFPKPLALCYHGHQFGHYNPDLGDGRGFLFAQMRDQHDRLMDLGTKGSGTTPFSRSADGRLTLKGAVREILATEMLTALDVTTSQSFSVIETGEHLERNDEPSPTRSAVLVRLSHSHIRIGSFQRLAYMDDMDGIEMLARHVARHYFGGATQTGLFKDNGRLDADAPLNELLPALLSHVAAAIADTAGRWLAAGFVHGVLNTDNFNITGESFDYGPWRFLQSFEPGLTAAYFDQTGRYAYGRQSDAALWAVCRLADCFVKLVPQKDLEDRLATFYPLLEARLAKQMQWRLGVVFDEDDPARDSALARDIFGAAKQSQCGFDQMFHDLYGGKARVDGYDDDCWRPVLEALQAAKPRNPAALDHPHFQSAKALSMTIDEVEAIWAPIAASDDWSLLSDKIAAIHQMRHAYGGDSALPLPSIIGGTIA